MDVVQLLLANGANVALVVMIAAIIRGDLRTKQEVCAWKEQAQRQRADVQELVIAVNALGDAVTRQHALLEHYLAELGHRAPVERKD